MPSYYVDEDYPAGSNNLCLDEAITVAQNRPLWRLMSTFHATHSLVVHAAEEEEEDPQDGSSQTADSLWSATECFLFVPLATSISISTKRVRAILIMLAFLVLP